MIPKAAACSTSAPRRPGMTESLRNDRRGRSELLDGFASAAGRLDGRPAPHSQPRMAENRLAPISPTADSQDNQVTLIRGPDVKLSWKSGRKAGNARVDKQGRSAEPDRRRRYRTQCCHRIPVLGHRLHPHSYYKP